jgi:VanZ family protein
VCDKRPCERRPWRSQPLLASGSRFSDGSDRLTIKRIAKICSVAVIVLVAITALGPAQWQLRTRLGWEVDHVIGYFAITLLVCLAWPRPLVVGSALVAFAVLLEALQSLTPDRIPNLMAALYGAGGVLVAALFAELFIRTRGQHTG